MQLLCILMQICKNMQLKKLIAESTYDETSRYLIRIVITKYKLQKKLLTFL